MDRDYDFVENPTVAYPVEVQILEILSGQRLRIILKQNVEKLGKLIQKQSIDNTCKVTSDTNYVLVEKADGFAIGVKTGLSKTFVVGPCGHIYIHAIRIKFFGTDTEQIVSRAKAGVHERLPK